jgi:plastocyanin
VKVIAKTVLPFYLTLAAAGLSLIVALAGCGSAGSRSATPPAAALSDSQAVVVHMENMKFDRGQLEVPAGTTVRWLNSDQTAHSVYEGVPNSGKYLFKSANLSPGKSFDYQFDKPGAYQVFCNTAAHYMVGMKMTVVVK